MPTLVQADRPQRRRRRARGPDGGSPV